MSATKGWPAAALLSLSDKRGARELARALSERGTRIVASGGTAKHLEEAGIPVTQVESWTGWPEMLGGRVKTLHPLVHAPILARRGVADDMEALEARGVGPIDLVAVTLYPFEERAGGLDEAGATEEIDIGGVALLRAAAKNYASVTVVHDPSQFEAVLAAYRAGGPSLEQRREWALATFARTARYDAAIAADLARRSSGGEAGGEPPPVHVVALERVRGLRYGENPHQAAALYAPVGDPGALQVLREGKELSYNNLLDVEAAVLQAGRYDEPACVIVKHNQPCGVACAATVGEAYAAALRCDPLSAYGGIVAFNRPLDGATAIELGKQFVECVVAPAFDRDADEALKSKKNLRALNLTAEDLARPERWDVRIAGRWALLQRDTARPDPEWKTVTRREPSGHELEAMRFVWEVVAAARSNAIALARGSALIGLGSGQTSRVDAVDVALMKARRAGHDLNGAVLASDGFFPFADNIEHAAQAGIAAVVQPGGSMRDAEVIAACDAHDIAMVFTDRRVFRH
ncbi:MAG TPA: bifunctional phosphoribosylaminoimidazolecarboxamide formyltransferase/IMP cyclohydrolase [Candidatus Eisenbacteria bacterium]|nr:bifunctional phosphoribosylaminoimidazolecarboxamide formyltransferase/IMP cyclohydrolase [Candidatus Eisenbacteria bacterium]